MPASRRTPGVFLRCWLENSVLLVMAASFAGMELTLGRITAATIVAFVVTPDPNA